MHSASSEFDLPGNISRAIARLSVIARDVLGEARPADAVEFVVEEADVEAGVVDDDLGAGHELQQLVGDRREQRLVGQELVGQAVHPHRVRVAGALRVEVEVQVARPVGAG